MSKQEDHPTPAPARIPITTRGNAFWQGSERFFVKGITYIPRTPHTEAIARNGTLADALSEAWLPELEEDIPHMHDIGLNSISIMGLEALQDHTKAMQYLESQGIYVMVSLFNDLRPPRATPKNMSSFQPHSDNWPIYDPRMIAENFRLIDQLSRHPNLLGFVVNGDWIHSPTHTKLAEVMRACVRDSKAFLRARGGRQVPVGITTGDIRQFLVPTAKYFSAGSRAERADFFANESFSWVGPSSFHVSGWMNMVEVISKATNMPMLLAEYGANVSQVRPWDEVPCLYSPDMTGVYSGGFIYTFLERNNCYGIIKVDEAGKRVLQSDYANLKKSFRQVNSRSPEEIASAETKSYEEWIGEFPECDSTWQATADIPPVPRNWHSLLKSDA